MMQKHEVERLLDTPIAKSNVPYSMMEGGLVFVRGYERCRMACRKAFEASGTIDSVNPELHDTDGLRNEAEARLYKEGYRLFYRDACKTIDAYTRGNGRMNERILQTLTALIKQFDDQMKLFEPHLRAGSSVVELYEYASLCSVSLNSLYQMVSDYQDTLPQARKEHVANSISHASQVLEDLKMASQKLEHAH